jgi:hypothetical protein
MIVVRAVAFSAMCVVAFSSDAHDGLLDSYGCHRNIAHGTYHCHTGPLAQRQFSNKEDMLQALAEQERRARPKPKLMPSGYQHSSEPRR